MLALVPALVQAPTPTPAPGLTVTPTPPGLLPTVTRTPSPGPSVTPTATRSPGLSPTPTPSPGGPNLIQNGDFENGDLGWSTSPSVITNQAQAHSGFWCAWMGGYGHTHTDTLSQTVDLTGGGSSAELSFWLHIETEEVQDKVFDTLKVQIADETGNVLQTLHTFSNRAANPHYERVHFDVSPFLGQRVQIRFVASEDNAKATSFFIDSVRLLVN